MDRKLKILYWVFFNVLIALSPLAFNYLFHAIITFSNLQIHFLFSRGELFLISAAIAADAIGESVIGTIKNKFAKVITVGFCVILVMVSSFLFAIVSISLDASLTLSEERVTYFSIFVFVATLIFSGISKYLSGRSNVLPKKKIAKAALLDNTDVVKSIK